MDYVLKYERLLAMAGAVALCFYVIKVVLYVCRGIRSFLLSPLFGLSIDPTKLGKWAVVTGATDGIGKAYAIALAKKGVNIVLMSRSADKLKAVAKEIEDGSNVMTKCVVVDFSGGVEIYDRLEQELENLDIGLLVNNVGMAYDYPEFFHKVSDREHTFNRMLHINIFPVTFLTAIVLPKMVENGKGAIVNVGSSSSHGFPLLTVYAATKAYVDSLSQNLAEEYASKGIIIQSVMPHVVATNMSKVRKAGWATPTAQAFSSSSLATLGLEPVTTGYYSHWIVDSIATHVLPDWMRKKITFSLVLAVRNKALKRMASTKSD